MHLRGIGPISALALFASIGKGNQFKNAQPLSAWLMTQHYSIGGKVQLSSVSKRKNVQLRVLMIHRVRTAHNWAARRDNFFR